MRRAARAVGAWMPLACLWLVAVLVMWLIAARATEAEGTAVAPGEVDTVVVGARIDDAIRPVTVEVLRGPAVELGSPRAGTVTSVPLVAGDAVLDGAVVVEIDAVPLLAFVADAPLYRDLSANMEGPDVRALGEFLVAREFMSAAAVTDRFGGALRRAVSAYQRAIGVEADGVFRTEYVLFVPAPGGIVGGMQVRPGEALQPHDTVVRLTSAPVGVQVEPSEEGRPLSVFEGEAVTLSSGGQDLALSSSRPESAEWVAVSDFLAALLGQGTIERVDPDLDRFTGLTMRRTEPRSSGVVPATAVHGDMSGQLCVVEVTAHGDESIWILDEATPAQGEIGQVLVPVDLVGRTIVRWPESTDRTCDSN